MIAGMTPDPQHAPDVSDASAMPRLAPITWIDTWLRLATLAILLIVGLHNLSLIHI